MKKIIAPLLITLIFGLLPPVRHAAGKNRKPPPFRASPEVREFIRDMHEQHGFDVTTLTCQFAATHVNTTVLRAIRPAAVPEQQRSWQRYRERFVNERQINHGLQFWQENGAELVRAEAL